MQVKSPIFVVGCPRSGTTLLGLMLDCHPDVSITHEAGIFHLLYHHPGRLRWNLSSIASNQKFFERLQYNSNLQEAFGKNVVSAVIAELQTKGQLTAKVVIDCLFAAFLRQTGKSIWGDKTPTHFYYVGDILSLYPQARVVFVTRDPRAVFASMKRYAKKTKGTRNQFWWMTENPEKASMLWLDAYESWAKWKDKIFLVKYEELVQGPELTLRKLTDDYLKISYDSDMLKYYEKAEDKIGNIPEWHKPTTHKVNPGEVDRWRLELTSKEIAQVECILHGQMKQFGYELENYDENSGRLKVTVKRSAYVAKRKINQSLRFSAWQILRWVRDTF